MKVAILTSPNQWFVDYAKDLQLKIRDSVLFFEHKNLHESFDILFILGYHKIIEEKYLKLNLHNIVIHESDLPKGKGWAPLFWQILEGQDEIVFSMFEASNGIDNGNIYMKKRLILDGTELNKQLRAKQAELTIQMCLEFIKNYEKYKFSKPQVGEESFYKKRTAKDSELNIEKSINEQFNLFRIVDNENYPAFFYKGGEKYILKIEKASDEKVF
ncbi:formyltransferase family protein [Arcobacter arenosus]|uniref:Methionyl-tRNA formyltransferase n=1 Tax=Arcobacter arenosus TaxID=2576037 RepID=A0A5R8Y1Q3_9BACT|nr:formyltransferase family protein [Arcobacter arenosus]TLP38533.1 methionyl-tRNA formyltransferase [Arcobacter arenosus]